MSEQSPAGAARTAPADPDRPRTMSVARLMRDFAPVSKHTWADERAWLLANHPRRMARIRRLIVADGFTEPVRLCWGHPDCGDRRHVVDGHHRIVVADQLGIRRIPVADAWEPGSDWMFYADDNPGDDPAHTRLRALLEET